MYVISRRKVEIWQYSSMTRTLAIFGQAGSGKTSLCNTLFGIDWRTDPAVDCTQTICHHTGNFVLPSNKNNYPKWKVHDTPGIAASEEIKQERLQIISNIFHHVDAIIWVIQADTRALRADQEAILELTKNGEKIPSAHFVLVINQIDRIYPENWNDVNNIPSQEQYKIIPEKIELAYKRFFNYLPISIENIIPCSTIKKYGLELLVETVNKEFIKS
jgi:uncharacterized protein